MYPDVTSPSEDQQQAFQAELKRVVNRLRDLSPGPLSGECTADLGSARLQIDHPHQTGPEPTIWEQVYPLAEQLAQLANPGRNLPVLTKLQQVKPADVVAVLGHELMNASNADLSQAEQILVQLRQMLY